MNDEFDIELPYGKYFLATEARKRKRKPREIDGKEKNRRSPDFTKGAFDVGDEDENFDFTDDELNAISNDGEDFDFTDVDNPPESDITTDDEFDFTDVDTPAEGEGEDFDFDAPTDDTGDDFDFTDIGDVPEEAPTEDEEFDFSDDGTTTDDTGDVGGDVDATADDEFDFTDADASATDEPATPDAGTTDTPPAEGGEDFDFGDPTATDAGDTPPADNPAPDAPPTDAPAEGETIDGTEDPNAGGEDFDFTDGAEDMGADPNDPNADPNAAPTEDAPAQPQGHGVDYDSMRKYILYKEFRALMDSITRYIDRIKLVVADEPDQNKTLNICVKKLDEVHDQCYDFLLYKFELAKYTQCQIFYQRLKISTEYIFELLKKVPEFSDSDDNKNKKKVSKTRGNNRKLDY